MKEQFMTRRGLSQIAASLAIAALALLALLPASAYAASGQHYQSRHHRPHFFFHREARHLSPAASGNNLNYGGGPVMGGTTNVYAIFWEPTGSVSANYNSLIERYFNDVGGTQLYNNNTQYTDSVGNVPSNTQLAGTWVDTSAYPESPLLDSDIQNEVTNAQNANGWSSSIDNIFFVFLEQNQDLCFDSSYSQ
jgi:hypothetical protein